TLQYVTALAGSSNRLSAAAARGYRVSDVAFETADLLAEYHLRHGSLDLAAESAKEALGRLAEVRAGRVPAQDFEREYAARRKQLEQLEAEVNRRRDRLELDAEGKPAAIRFALAARNGLPGEALKEVERLIQSGDAEKLQGLDAEVLSLMLQVGRAEE